MLLSDNFDYQTIARDLVPGVLSEQELGSTLHVHELARVRCQARWGRHGATSRGTMLCMSGTWPLLPSVQGYVERARTTAEYAGITEDVLSRWAYPWVPDNSGDEQDLCRFNRGAYV